MMPKGKRTRYFVHRDGFEDGTAFVRYEGLNSHLVIVERAERELRSDLQRVEAGLWRELTPRQATEILRKKRPMNMSGTRRLPRHPPKCWFIFWHRWGKWEQWGITFQRRECLDCGRGQIRDQ
jgi:hypothetical protein